MEHYGQGYEYPPSGLGGQYGTVCMGMGEGMSQNMAMMGQPIMPNMGIGQSASLASMDLETKKQFYKKGKRRSKNDIEGRIYKCTNCDKTYLSYPALYTHIKTKHGQGESIGGSLSHDRRRGRPKKNIICRMDPTKSDFLNSADKQGGPTEIIYGFEVLFSILKDQLNWKYVEKEHHPLYKMLYQQHLRNFADEAYANRGGVNLKQENLDNIPSTNSNILGRLTYENSNITADQMTIPPSLLNKEDLNIDDIFCAYLNCVCFIVNQGYYETVMKFVMLLRECLNQYGWQTYFHNTSPEVRASITQTPTTIYMTLTPAQLLTTKDEFVVTNNAEFVPHLANEFVLNYNQKVGMKLEKNDAIDLTRNFCHWIYKHGLTCSQIAPL